jgi:hypothetical protein
MVFPELDDFLPPPPETFDEVALALEAVDEPDAEAEDVLKPDIKRKPG